MPRLRRAAFVSGLAVATALVLGFLLLPVVALVTSATPRELIESLGRPESVDALLLSLRTTLIALLLIVLLGTPTAYLLASRRFRGRELLITVIELPLVLPPAVAGLALLMAFGPQGPAGKLLGDAGITLVLQTAGVVVAVAFVAAPFYIRQAQAAFSALGPTPIEAARTLGASEARALLLVAVPAARGGLLAGLALAWGRALGEFGATLMFAGSFRGVTQTAPLAIYELFATDLNAALALSTVLLAVSAALLLSVKLLAREKEAHVAAR